jgi:hypothetical protein
MRDIKRLSETLGRAKRVIHAVDTGATFSTQDLVYTMSSGYKYQFGHCHRIDDYQKYDSNEFTMLLWDELTQFDEEQFDQISLRLRTDDPVLIMFLKNRGMSNPQRKVSGNAQVRDPFWVRRRFVDSCREGNKIVEREYVNPDGVKNKTTYIYLPATLDDNPDPVFVKVYKEQLAGSHKPHIVRAMLYGDWYVVPGAFFADAWLENMHTCNVFRPPSEWKFFRSMDWGYKNYGVVHWYAMDREDTLFVIREYTFKLKSCDVVAGEIRDIEIAMGLWSISANRSKISGPADTQLWQEMGNVGRNMGQIMLDLGVPWFKADKRSRRVNAQRVMTRLTSHEVDDCGVAGIKFFKNSPRIIEQITAVGTDPLDDECPVDGKQDHWLDSLFYGVAYASIGQGTIPAMISAAELDERAQRRSESKNRRHTPKGRGWGYGTR